MKLFVGSDMLFSAIYSNEANNFGITSGTLSATLWDDRADAQLGGTLTGAHVSNGLWNLTIPNNHPGILVGMRLRFIVTMNGGAGLVSVKRYYLQAVEDEAW
jgi:hypothetical protein